MSTSYTFLDTHHTLGALAVGLSGSETGPVPLPVRNDSSNLSLPPGLWLELPTFIKNGKFLPQTPSPLPDWLLSQIGALAQQRSILADWFAGKDAEDLTKTLLIWPRNFPVASLLAFAKEMRGKRGQKQP